MLLPGPVRHLVVHSELVIRDRVIRDQTLNRPGKSSDKLGSFLEICGSSERVYFLKMLVSGAR